MQQSDNLGAVNFLRLPPEIQARILSHLVTTSPGPSPIQAVLRTCKQLHEVALPLSVQVFRNTPRHRDSYEPVNRTVRFLRYILFTRPELAKHVETAIFGCTLVDDTLDSENEDEGDGDDDGEEEEEVYGEETLGEGWEGFERNREPISPDELAVYKKRIEDICSALLHQYGEVGSTRWIKGLEKGSMEGLAALLLLSCPNIKALWYHDSLFLRKGAPYLLLTLAVWREYDHGIQLPLANLEHIFHECDQDQDGFALEDEAPLYFALPKLRCYEGVMAAGDREDEPARPRWPRGTSAVEEIILRKSGINARTLKSMTGACKALRRFEFTHGVYYFETKKMVARDLMEAILPHKESLEYLYVNMEDDWDKLWEPPHERWYMGTALQQMTALKTLSIGMQALTGMFEDLMVCRAGDLPPDMPPERIEGAPRLVECLPDNLEHLEIRGCGKAILDQAKELLGMIESGKSFNNLRHVRFLFNQETTRPDDINLSCKAPGMKLNIIVQSAENRNYDNAGRFHIITNGHEVEHVCSLIHGADLREEWLETRGNNLDRTKVGAAYGRILVG